MNIKQVVEKVRMVNSLLATEDKEVLAKYAKRVSENGVIVDVGTHQGSSAFTMALASKKSVKVFTVDPNAWDSFLTKRKELNLMNKVFYLQETSVNASQEWSRPINLIFIDAIHSYGGIMEDFQAWSKFVKKGGYMIFHDYLLYEGIKEAVDELVNKGLIRKIELVKAVFEQKGVSTGIFVSKKC
jgi:predicted O-methyltransferase YrrM